MTDYVSQYQQALRFAKVIPPPEETAIRSAISRNPLDANSHFALSDHLREQGRHDEADWHRAYGEWLINDYPTVRSKVDRSALSSDRMKLPAGLTDRGILDYRTIDTNGPTPVRDYNRVPMETHLDGEHTLKWVSPHGMEKSLRQSYLYKLKQANRKSEQ